jgi:hypothetical protein
MIQRRLYPRDEMSEIFRSGTPQSGRNNIALMESREGGWSGNSTKHTHHSVSTNAPWGDDLLVLIKNFATEKNLHRHDLNCDPISLWASDNTVHVSSVQIWIRDLRSSAFWPLDPEFGSGILDEKNPDPGSETRNEHPGCYFWELSISFVG